MSSQVQPRAVSEDIELRIIDRDGVEHSLTALPGQSLMELATSNSIAGIDGDCGGCCACGTCRMELPPDIAQRLEPPAAEEAGLLEFTGELSDNHRLGCQVPVSSLLDGCLIRVATE